MKLNQWQMIITGLAWIFIGGLSNWPSLTTAGLVMIGIGICIEKN